MNIIGDVAGRFDEFLKLREQMPKEKFIFVGDLNDRGKQSKQMIEWVMNDPDSMCLHSNHGAMFVDFYDGIKSYYDAGDFIRNGGFLTLVSYGYPPPTDSSVDVRHAIKWLRENMPKEHIEWLSTRPWYYEEDGLFVSHAAKNPLYSVEKVCTDTEQSYDYSLIWNRGSPREMKGKLQVMGHNSQWGVKWFGPADKNWAVCIDDSRKEKLTGLHWPSLKIYQQGYLDS